MENFDIEPKQDSENKENGEDAKMVYNDLLNLKRVILKQNEIIKQLTEKVVGIAEELSSLKMAFFNRSTGNDGVNQSINQSIEQTINQTLSTSSSGKTIQNPNFKQFQTIISETFKGVSKQEIKTFLAVYQLEDEQIEASYSEIAIKMGLSENCVRAYISGLLRKKLPLFRKKVRNKKSFFYIDPDFKVLNLKNQLIKLYYDQDPTQSTLF